MVSMRKIILYAYGAIVMSALAFSCAPPARAAEPTSSPDKVLLDKYVEIKGKLEKNQFGLPLYLESEAKGDNLQGDVYGIIDYPYYSFGDALQLPAEWCSITPLDLNIKACTYRKVDNQYELTLYSGNKHYQPPESANKLELKFHVVANSPDYLHISLTADKGPFFTRDYRIGLEAVALDKARTFVHFRYSYSYGMFVRILIKTYFATAGHDKMGFSIVGIDKNSNPIYVTGVRGALERNAVRYYLAILAYMDTLKFPANERFDKRIDEWFNLTEKYHRQLFEIDKEEYLTSKRKEHNNQLKLQADSGE